MTDRWEQLQALFHEAVDRPPAERAAFLDSATDDAGLRAEVVALLEAHDERGALDRVAEGIVELGADRGRPTPALPPRHRIGAYAVLRPIAHGGMGSVYLAERADGQFEATVALKLLRRDIETDELSRRFLSERQILAQINHPNIARLLDGGVTEEGRPYIVMEHVEGAPLDVYCDEHRLTIPERLELFRTVCSAVEHAHRNLVVHRDLKPSNILVTEDGTVKLLDFGIAKVLDPDAHGADTTRTAAGLRLLTPRFASPEQLRGDPVTTASDVYQLGLVLELLLTGRVPRLRDGARSWRGAADPTRDVAPPSVVLDDPVPAGPGDPATEPDTVEIAAARSTTPDRLRRQLKGDLDNIALLALREEPERRYGSVQQLSEDIRRHLEGLPVTARSERLGYVAAKFIRRHRVGVGASALVAVALLGFAVVANLQAAKAARERDRTQQVTELLLDMFESAGPTVARGETLTVAAVLDRGVRQVRSGLSGDPRLRATMLGTIASVHQDLGDWGTALELAREAHGLRTAFLGPNHRETLASLLQIASLQTNLGALDSAVATARRALEGTDAHLGHRSILTARAAGAYGFALQLSGEIDRALPLLERAVAIARDIPGDSARLEVALHLSNLAWLYENRQNPDRALASLREAHTIRSDLLEPDHPLLMTAAGGLGNLLMRYGQLEEADSILSRHLELSRQIFPEGHSAVAGALHGYGSLLSRRGELDRAEKHFREALETFRSAEGDSSLGLAQTLNDLGLLLQYRRGDAAAAEPLFREAAAVFAALRGPDDPWTAMVEGNLGVALYSQGQFRPAAPLLAHSVAVQEASYSATAPSLRFPLVHYGTVLTRLGQVAEAEPVLRRAIDIATSVADSAQAARAEVALGIGMIARRELPEAEATLNRARTTLARLPTPDPFLAWADEALEQLRTTLPPPPPDPRP